MRRTHTHARLAECQEQARKMEEEKLGEEKLQRGPVWQKTGEKGLP